ncbi:cobaltochelatase subunit CobN [Methanococcoides sp. SA1]|nr:cobaltochelatase subunit CobN [Methanococcoides sp. SA1]
MQKIKHQLLLLSVLIMLALSPVVSADENKVNIAYIAYSPSSALEMGSLSHEHSSEIEYIYIPAYNTTSWGPSDELLAAAQNGFLAQQNVILCDMFSSGIFDPMNNTLSALHDNGTSLLDIRSTGTPEYFDYVSNGSIDDTICNYYNNMGTDENGVENAEKLLSHISIEYGNQHDITDDWMVLITYIAYSPSAALDLGSQSNIHHDDILYSYIPAYNTTSWGPSDELLEASQNGQLARQDILFCDMFSSGIFDPMNDTFSALHDNGASLLDIRSTGTPEYFDYVSNGSIDDIICNYYNNLGTDPVGVKNAEDMLLYLADEYGNKSDVTDNWVSIKISYIAYSPSTALANASQSNPYAEFMEYNYIPAYNTTSWGPSDELLESISSGVLAEQNIIFCDMFSSGLFIPLNDTFADMHDNGTSLLDIRSTVTPAYFDYVSNGSINDTICNYYNNMGISTSTELRNAESLLVYIAKEYGGEPALTAGWDYANFSSGLPAVGLYHPDYGYKYFETTAEYLEWYQQESTERRVYDPSRPTIGMWFHRADVQNGQTGVVDALIEDIESKDCNVIVGFDTFDDIVQYYCDENEEPLVQSVISLKSFRLNYFDPLKGEEELKKLNVPVLRGIVAEISTSTNVADANSGIPNAQMVRKTISPNLDGIFEYILVGQSIYDAESMSSEYVAIDGQVDWISNRSIKWAELKLAENEDKKVAVIYYNYPSGKDNIGASYLDTITSMRLLLDEMDDANYTVSDLPANNSELLERIWAQGINAGSWSPGVLDEMVENRTEWGLQLIPMETYKQWFEEELPEDLRNSVIEEWGEPWAEELPENKSVMIWENETGQYLVIPAVQYGNVWLMPQPARGFMQNDDTLYHSSVVPPTHQYIGFYLWLNNEWQPDAIIHFGTHGTHEWLPGKSYGLDRKTEWAPLLLQDLPNIYPYIVANVGEGLTAEYRGNALIIDHMTPTLERSGSYGKIEELSRLTQIYYGPEMSSETKAAYQAQIVYEIGESHIDSDLGLNITDLASYNESEFSSFVKNVLHEYIEEIEGENIPYGMHIFGETPAMNTTGYLHDELSLMVRSMLKSGFERSVLSAFYPEEDYPLGVPFNDTRVDQMLWEVVTNGTDVNESQMMFYGKTNESVTEDLVKGLVYRDRLVGSSIEMDRLLSALDAGFIPAGPGTDPVMNPESVPTGRNFYGVNPELYPSKATWLVGKQMAINLIDATYDSENSTYPDTIAFSRFGVEFIRDHGTLEAAIMYTLGIRPVWDEDNGYVIGVEEIPEEELLPNYDPSVPGRPRIDIVYLTAGMRDAFPSKVQMIDDSVKLANSIESVNYPNYVREHSESNYEQYYEELSRTMDEEAASNLARKLSTMRCYAVRDGTYEIGTGNAMGASGSWESDEEIVNIYLEKMGFLYGSELWGYEFSQSLMANLMNVDASVHSVNSNLYNSIDNDDFFQYFGALNLAIRNLSGDNPDAYVVDGSDPEMTELSTLKEYFMKDLRTTAFNPKWIEGMKESGYAGGRMMAEIIDNVWLAEVSDPNLVDDSTWEMLHNTYVNDEMGDWFNENNPGAYQSITGRMLEAVRKGYWDAPQEIVDHLVKEYVESVVENGVTCCHHTCGNIPLDDYVVNQALASGAVSESTLDDYQRILEEATQREVPKQEVSSSTVSSNGGSSSGKAVVSESGNQTSSSTGGYGTDLDVDPSATNGADAPDNYVEGYEMTTESTSNTESESSPFSTSDIVGTLILLASVGMVYVGFMRKK